MHEDRRQRTYQCQHRNRKNSLTRTSVHSELLPSCRWSTSTSAHGCANANGAVCTRYTQIERLAASTETQQPRAHCCTHSAAACIDSAARTMHRPAIVAIAAVLQAHAFQRPPRHVHPRLVLKASGADDVNSLMTQLNAAVQQEDFRKAAELKKQLDALRGDGDGLHCCGAQLGRAAAAEPIGHDGWRTSRAAQAI